MILRIVKWEKLNDELAGKRNVVFGAGSNYRYCIEPAFTENVKNSIVYAIDNNLSLNQININGTLVNVYRVEKLKEESNCAVLLCGLDQLLEMYKQLESMDLPDSIECYALPLSLSEYCGDEDIELKGIAFDEKRQQRIPKIIHTFWFSGDEIPESYARCIDSWKQFCPDYEIKIWNSDTYDINGNRFVKKAIQARKWAFASDYARLDVINKFGGIYMDMDVELCRTMASLLGNRAFFTFESGNEIEPAIMGAEKSYPALQYMLNVYKDMKFEDSDEAFKEYCMPHLMRQPLEKFGVKMDGTMQMIDGAVFLPRKYFSPMDNVVYETLVQTDETIVVHLMNGSWKDGGSMERKRKNNRKLRDIFYQRAM